MVTISVNIINKKTPKEIKSHLTYFGKTQLFPKWIRAFAGMTIAGLCCVSTSCIYTTAASTGAQAVYHRHDLQETVSDNYLTLQIYRALQADPARFGDGNISVATDGEVVLLAGQVRTLQQKKAIEKQVKNMRDGRQVYNYLEIANPNSVLTRTGDAWITTKIKSQLIAINDVDPSRIKVVTENGTVFLIGVVPHRDATIAIDVARDTDGVQRVVKIFSYIYIRKV